MKILFFTIQYDRNILLLSYCNIAAKYNIDVPTMIPVKSFILKRPKKKE